MSRFYIDLVHERLVDSDNKLSAIHFRDKVDFAELCDFLNEQEMEKLEYKRRLNTLKHKITKIAESI